METKERKPLAQMKMKNKRKYIYPSNYKCPTQNMMLEHIYCPSIDTIDYVHGIGNEVTCAHSDNTIFLRIP